MVRLITVLNYVILFHRRGSAPIKVLESLITSCVVLEQVFFS